jgi:hypothetical protein
LDQADPEIRSIYEQLFTAESLEEERELTDVIIEYNDAMIAKYEKSNNKIRRPKTRTETEKQLGYWDKESPHYLGKKSELPVVSGNKVMSEEGIVHTLES